MKNLKQLKEERGAKIKAAKALTDLATTEKRELTSEENTQFDTLSTEIEEIDKQIERAGRIEANNAAAAATDGTAQRHTTEEQKVSERFSFIKAIRAAGDPDKLTGIEKEMHQEAVKEARGNNQEIQGVGIPMVVLRGQERRDNTVTVGDQPADGRVLVHDEYRDMIPLLRDRLVTATLGVTVLTGLVGDVVFPTQTQGATSTWKGEIEELDKSNIKFGSQKMSPHRLGTYADFSLQLLRQSSMDIENLVRDEIINSVTRAVDIAAIYGDGQDNEPLGLLNNTGISKLVGGTNGAVPNLITLATLESMVEVANAAQGNLKYLFSNKTKGTLKTQPVADGNPLMVLTGNNEVNGYPFVASNLIKDKTKGTATAASALVFGNWSDLYLGQWGGLDLVRDNITLALKGEIRLVVNSFWDIMLRRQKSFAAMLDAVPNASIGQLPANV